MKRIESHGSKHTYLFKKENKMGFRRMGLAFAGLMVLGGTAPGAVVEQGYYGLGESGTVGTSSPFKPLKDTLNSHNITSFQAAGGTASIVAPGAGGAPGSTAALTLAQNSGRSSGWAGTTPTYGLTTDWALQLWFKTPDTTTTGQSYIFVGTNGSAGTNSLSLELNNNHVNVLNSTNTAARLTGFAYTPNTWMQITLVNYNGVLNLYNGSALEASGTLAGETLSDLRLGFGSLAPSGRGASGTWDEMSVWSFNHTTDSQAAVESALGIVAVPSPAALPAGLALLGLTAFSGRRRRA